MRLGHLARFLAAFDPSRGPLDLAWRAYAKRNPALGSKDRQWIGERIYLHEKLRSLFEALEPEDWVARAWLLASWPELPPERIARLREAERFGVSEDLWRLLVDAYGQEGAEHICQVQLEEAPLFIRINPLKTTRDEFLKWVLEQEPRAHACENAPWGISLPARTQVSKWAAYQQGLFEIQDEGSQMVAELVDVQPGQEALDYCAGAGGKSLVIAAKLRGTGQLFLHDIRERALAEAKLRLRRAGNQNAQIVLPESKALRGIRQRCDWVFVDAPCSGTGTFRRNPDMKWRIHADELRRLEQLQRQIVLEAMQYVKPNGHLVYATCSILPQENEQQRDWIVQQGWSCLREWHSLPESGKMDGLYGAVFKKETGHEK
jgi:16S rRNA (cytosine967-C5)-methyltransferase